MGVKLKKECYNIEKDTIIYRISAERMKYNGKI
jgi:hypothetical protein